ncbi:polyphosphate kinase [Hydrogenispora ethanolica]|uniref:Polyphosphate kinase n=1 Tax=Hydrogenispora ethanolica TaxID=1082276 RepID=A0A4R1RU68_HYDET|nr:polyphosphate kinase 1 [Hydrogenispora ethanolica]TCL70108.1 polyphosphate kinase [Hydrogenispora ethanolica]
MRFPKLYSLQPTTTPHSDTPDSGLLINRELSWVRFNLRVLEEALDPAKPLLERVKFLAIFANNLDEFFMIRISGLHQQIRSQTVSHSPDGLSPLEQLNQVNQELSLCLNRFAECWHRDLLPQLWEKGIRINCYDRLQPEQRRALRRYFQQEIFPVLTPLAFDPGHPFPHISNLSLNLAFVVTDPASGAEKFARLKVPDLLPRFLPLPDADCDAAAPGETADFIWLEEVIAANADLLFPGMQIEAAYPFRVTRDADLTIEEDEASDLLETIQESVEMRQFGSVVRLEITRAMPERIRSLLLENLDLAPYQLYTVDCPLGMAALMELAKLDRPDLKDAPFTPRLPEFLSRGESIFGALQRRDILLYHPYDSFNPVVEFIREAARDPQVLAIKQTLYRVGANSPIVDALLEARENGKQVAVLVELKARFDEENNILWAQALEQAGVHVVYGLMGLKTHAKMCLVVRKEPGGLVRYVHLGTGNYNPVTARLYTDLSYFSRDPALGSDVSDLFNAITGYSHKSDYQKLIAAPAALRRQILARIEREIENHRQNGGGYLAFKMNSLVDPECIRALYRASQAGVRVELQVRSICCLRPGVPGVSENIRVTSIVGRLLEHARIYYFRNGGADEVLLGSADLMPRNLDRRVEVLFPVTDAALREMLIHGILQLHLRDNCQSRLLLPTGQYQRIAPGPDEVPLNSQQWLMENDWFTAEPAGPRWAAAAQEAAAAGEPGASQ